MGDLPGLPPLLYTCVATCYQYVIVHISSVTLQTETVNMHVYMHIGNMLFPSICAWILCIHANTESVSYHATAACMYYYYPVFRIVQNH